MTTTIRPETTQPRGTGDGERPPALELLVHGVGGTTPETMLGTPHVVRVAGDETAAVYRRPADVDAERRPAERDGRPVPEAYSWSNLTSGDGSRALWLLLLPFMVINLAHWTRPPATARPRVRRLYGLLVRLLALSLTVLLVAGVCEVALDLVAWQCAGSAACAADRSWLGFVSAERGGWWSQPGRRLALAALAPAAVTGLLWYLSRRTWRAYESVPPLDPAADQGDDGEVDEGAGEGLQDPDNGPERTALRLPGFWFGRRIVARLRAAHTAAGLLTAAAAVTAAAARQDRRPGGSAWLDACGWALLALLAGAFLAVLYVVCRRGRSEKAPDRRPDGPATTALPAASLALFALALLYAAWSRPGWTSAGLLPGEVAFGVVAAVQAALVVALAGCALALYRAAPVERTPLSGLSGAAVAMLACALGAVFCGGLAQRVADWLDGRGTPGTGDGPIPGPPTLLTWQATVIPVLLLLAVAVLLALAWQASRVRRRIMSTVPDGYPGEPADDEERTRGIAAAIARAGLTDSAPAAVGFLSLGMLLAGAGALAGAWATGEVPGRAADGAPGIVDAAAETAQALGSWLMGLAVLALLALARRAYRSTGARRTVGILWDVGTFWPRAAHPFAPPCYAERAVPDLTWRMRQWTSEHDGRLVISGHSQGSVLAAAATWQLDGPARARVALLTYGSPLERMYGRWFPAYFGPPSLSALHREVRCWRNLWRYTDPIGGPVRLPDSAGPEVDCGALKDPVAYGRTPANPLPAPILGHSDYQADPAFAAERAALLDRLPDRALPGVPAQGPPPRAGAAGDGPVADAGGGQGSSGRSSG
ncbi:hypothetical protein RKE29_19625 [Streptomyces sp. B1866]|uniref:hypothetical protein n=1 Tax=Streptomyces sp. B1866 TaxID=3075431 RepID=UPI0028910EDE|nr:hypothetical protein [Streptomyces sp. B1866]MDT3398830.1 hypothetical protein [Streptomyces sp. B1866]